jgi:hypothetical protein
MLLYYIFALVGNAEDDKSADAELVGGEFD